MQAQRAGETRPEPTVLALAPGRPGNHRRVLELIPRLGSYVDTGAAVSAVHGGTTLAAYRALADASPGHLRPGIEERCSILLDLIDAITVEPVRAAARHPDRLGSG